MRHASGKPYDRFEQRKRAWERELSKFECLKAIDSGHLLGERKRGAGRELKEVGHRSGEEDPVRSRMRVVTGASAAWPRRFGALSGRGSIAWAARRAWIRPAVSAAGGI